MLAGAPTGNRLIGPLGRLARLWLTSRLGSRKLVFFICKPNRADLAAVRELIESGKVRPAVDRVYPLAEIADALEEMGDVTVSLSRATKPTILRVRIDAATKATIDGTPLTVIASRDAFDAAASGVFVEPKFAWVKLPAATKATTIVIAP